jgi:hypothetical protein
VLQSQAKEELDGTFEDLLRLNKDSLFAPESMTKSHEEKSESVKTEEVYEGIKTKEAEIRGLENQIQRTGFIVFDDYLSKLKMMNSPLFLFGMKLYRQQGHLEFFDADFCNTIMVQCPSFTGLTLGECCEIVNEHLRRNGFNNEGVKVGKLKDIDDFDLSKILVREEYKVSIRFNDFTQALEAFHALTLGKNSQKEMQFNCLFASPQPNYYDGKLATNFESCIKDKFEGLDEIKEVSANYVRDSLDRLKA